MATNKRYWLGKPGGRTGMVRLPSLEAGAVVPIKRGESTSGLLGGGVGSTYTPIPKRTWKLKRSWLSQTEQEILRSLYLGRPDKGPFRLIDPGERNLLSPDASTFGGFTANTSFWVPSGFTATRDGTSIVLPTSATSVRESDAITTGVVTAVSILDSNVSDNTIRIPRIPGVNYDFSIWVGMLTGTSTFLRCELISTNTVISTAVQLTGAGNWLRASVNATDAALGALTPFIDMRFHVVAPVVGSPTLILRAPQLTISDAAEEYALGLGVPAVVFTDGIMQNTPRTKFRDQTFSLAEI